MFRRTPLLWEVQVRRELLEAELAELRGLPYSVWRDVVGHSMWKHALGRDERTYRVRIIPSWVKGSAAVGKCVTLTCVLTSVAVLARPKSTSFAPDFVNITFPGFKSR